MTRAFHWNSYLERVLRALIVCACALGVWESWEFVRSERLYYRYTTDSIRAAIRIEPDCWYCYIPLAQRNEPHPEDLLRKSIKLNPYNSDALIDLGLRYEANGDLRGAEETLLQA